MLHCGRPLAVCLLLLAAASTHAADKELRYLQSKSVDPIHLLPPPPTVGSEEYKSQIDQIVAIQVSRSEAQIKRYQAEDNRGLAAFASVMPGWCTAENLPKLDKLIKAAFRVQEGPFPATGSAGAFEMNGRVDDQPPIHYSKKRFQKAEKGSLSQQLTQILG